MAPASDRIFLDTAFALGLLNSADELNAKARALASRLRDARQVVTTEAVLVEIANALAGRNRIGAYEFIQSCYSTANVKVVELTAGLFRDGLAEYRKHSDKQWSLTDCISFLVMDAEGITEAATRDTHYSQRGFTELLK